MVSSFPGRKPYYSLTVPQLLELVQTGDDQAAEDLWQRYEPLVGALTFRLTNHRDEAEDLFAEVRLKAIRTFPRMPADSTPAQWLSCVVRTTWSDRLRKRNRFQSVPQGGTEDNAVSYFEELVAPQRSPFELVAEQFFITAIREEIESIRRQYPQRAEALYQHLLNGKEFGEIGGAPAATWRSHYRRGRPLLAERLVRRFGGDDYGRAM